MAALRVLLILILGLGLTACATTRGYNGPEVTSIQVHKADRKLFLLHGNKVLETFKVKLGGNPVGPKQFEGDGKSPEGAYFITHRNPNSAYHLSLGISYPNTADRAFAASQGKRPGGDIFIHGGPQKMFVRGDWTAGCIAVSDRQIEQIYAMVNPGTPVFIYP